MFVLSARKQPSIAEAGQRQRGAVLIVSLILLLVLTMVVLSANRGVVIQERATNAVRESNVVFQVAESALLEAEAHINSVMAGAGVAAFNDNGTNGLYAEGKGPTDYLAKTTWAKNNTKAAAQLSTEGYSANYFIEHLGEMAMPGQSIGVDLNNNYNQADEIPMANVFRVVVRAQGSQGTPVRMLSGYYSF